MRYFYYKFMGNVCYRDYDEQKLISGAEVIKTESVQTQMLKKQPIDFYYLRTSGDETTKKAPQTEMTDDPELQVEQDEFNRLSKENTEQLDIDSKKQVPTKVGIETF